MLVEGLKGLFPKLKVILGRCSRLFFNLCLIISISGVFAPDSFLLVVYHGALFPSLTDYFLMLCCSLSLNNYIGGILKPS